MQASPGPGPHGDLTRALLLAAWPRPCPRVSEPKVACTWAGAKLAWLQRLDRKGRQTDRRRGTRGAARYTPVPSASSWRENRPEPPAHGLWATRPHTPFQYDAVRGKYQGFLRPKVPEKQDAGRVSSATFYPERESVIGGLNWLVQLFHVDTFHTHPMSEPGRLGPRRPPRPAQGHGGPPLPLPPAASSAGVPEAGGAVSKIKQL